MFISTSLTIQVHLACCAQLEAFHNFLAKFTAFTTFLEINNEIILLNAKNFSLLVLKDEPDDLTHLAPTAGDACIPLDETTPFFSDMFDDFIIPDNYNALLTDELNSLDSSCSKTTSSSSSNDPFINYRDDSNDICHSPHLLSPGLSKVKKHETWQARDR
jgi:hypothetical protein